MTYLLDTNACIYYLNGTHPVLIRRVLDAGPQDLAVSTITVAELYFGAARSSRPEANFQRVEAFVSELGVRAFDRKCAACFGTIKADLLVRGKPTPDFDIAIASTAMALGLVVVTSDRHLAHIPGLHIEDWNT